VRGCGVRTGVTFHLNPTDRTRLQAIVDDRNSPQKHVWRARIVLATADGLGTATIMRAAGVSKTAVWRWQERFMAEGVDGLLRDNTRPARAPKAAEVRPRYPTDENRLNLYSPKPWPAPMSMTNIAQPGLPCRLASA